MHLEPQLEGSYSFGLGGWILGVSRWLQITGTKQTNLVVVQTTKFPPGVWEGGLKGNQWKSNQLKLDFQCQKKGVTTYCV